MENIINTNNVNTNDGAIDGTNNKESNLSASSLTPIPQPLNLVSGRILSWISYLTLILLFTTINLTRDNGSFARWLIQCLPLLIFLPGLLRQTHRAYSWLCFVTLFYFISGVTNTMSPTGAWSDIVMLVAASALFIGAAFTSRWLQYWRHENNLLKNGNELKSSES